jgi:hypothetical protein
MNERMLRVTTATSLREKRLAALLQGRDPATSGLTDAVEEAEIVGSLALSGISATVEDVRAGRTGSGPEAVRHLLAARRAVAVDAPFSVAALVAWHRAACPPGGFRTGPPRDAPTAAPVAFIESRLQILEQWLNTDSRRQLTPSQAGALVLARVLEIVPFAEGNGRVARLAAAHLMAQGGARRPIFAASDAPRLAQAAQAAFQLATEPLASLLEEASDRCLDVMIRSLE